MIKIILLIISFISTVMINVLANTLPINHHTTGEVLYRLPALFTPANYVFLIWFVIYFLLACWIWNIIKEYRSGIKPPSKRVILFICSSVLNILWTIFWHHELFEFALIDIVALLGILFLIYKTYSHEKQSWMNRIPISIYLGWTFVALFINIDYFQTFVEFSGLGITKSLWVVIFLTIATAAALHIRYHYNDQIIVLVFIWAYIGIGFRHLFADLLITAASIFLTGVLIAGILFIKKMPRKI